GFHVTGVQTCALPIWEQYLTHLLSLRLLQDDTQGFNAIFISPSKCNPPEIETLLRLFFITKLFMETINVVTIEGDTVSPAMRNRSEERRGGKDGESVR